LIQSLYFVYVRIIFIVLLFIKIYISEFYLIVYLSVFYTKPNQLFFPK